jgi:hypothetical protein
MGPCLYQPDINGLRLSIVFCRIVTQTLAYLQNQRMDSRVFQVAHVQEDIRAAGIGHDETKATIRIPPYQRADRQGLTALTSSP